MTPRQNARCPHVLNEVVPAEPAVAKPRPPTLPNALQEPGQTTKQDSPPTHVSEASGISMVPVEPETSLTGGEIIRGVVLRFVVDAEAPTRAIQKIFLSKFRRTDREVYSFAPPPTARR